MTNIGSRAAVWHGNAKKTSGGLTKKDLFKKKGRIRSKRASKRAKKNNNLKKAGWTVKKGTFGAVRIGEKLNKGQSKKGSKGRKGRKGRKGKQQGGVRAEISPELGKKDTASRRLLTRIRGEAAAAGVAAGSKRIFKKDPEEKARIREILKKGWTGAE